MNSLLKRTTGDDAGPKLDINRYKGEGKLEETQNSSNFNLITCIKCVVAEIYTCARH